MVQAHLLRIVDPVTGQPLTLDRLEDEASIMFVVRMANKRSLCVLHGSL